MCLLAKIRLGSLANWASFITAEIRGGVVVTSVPLASLLRFLSCGSSSIESDVGG